MKTKCLIIDDEPLAIQVIETHLKQFSDLELVATFEKPLEAFELLKTEKVDLIFLDIEMPILSGIDFIKSLSNSPKIILTTAYRNYALEGYELDIVDYLLKPISFKRFFKAINKYRRFNNDIESESIINTEKTNNDHLYVNSNKKFIKINFEDILYIESIKDYIRIHLSDKSVITKDAISNFEKKLPVSFLRTHRSYIINTTKITAFTKLDIEIDNKEIPIGASYKNEVIAFLKDS
ncbi:response regulator [Flavobacteriaceae bacterium R38]|nr:response regulator [Flavobacteriaceae bacterium R38]